MEALQYVVKAGKACYIGASPMRARQFSKMQYLARLLGWTRFVSMQGQYSLVAREEEREMFPLPAGGASLPKGPRSRAGHSARSCRVPGHGVIARQSRQPLVR
jgi:hypothetical protein